MPQYFSSLTDRSAKYPIKSYFCFVKYVSILFKLYDNYYLTNCARLYIRTIRSETFPNYKKETFVSPKIIDKSKKSIEIARAALGLFSRNGYTSTSVRQIAEKAGIGKGTLYEYYSNKEEIFLGAVKEWMVDFDELVSDRLDSLEDPVDKLYAILDLKTEFWNPADMATARMIIEMLKHTVMKGGVMYERNNIMKEYHAKMQKIVMDILLEGISKGIFKPEIASDIEKIPLNFLAYADAIGWHCTIYENVDLQEQVNFYMRSMIELLCIDTLMTGDRETLSLAGT